MAKKYIITNANRHEIQQVPNLASSMYGFMGDDSMQVSDGYHTMDELYAHRTELYIALCKILSGDDDFQPTCSVWKSRLHADGSSYDGWFILGIYKEEGRQISYHIPLDRWNDLPLAQELEKAPPFDGHTSANVIERLRTFTGL